MCEIYHHNAQCNTYIQTPPYKVENKNRARAKAKWLRQHVCWYNTKFEETVAIKEFFMKSPYVINNANFLLIVEN